MGLGVETYVGYKAWIYAIRGLHSASVDLHVGQAILGLPAACIIPQLCMKTLRPT